MPGVGGRRGSEGLGSVLDTLSHTTTRLVEEITVTLRTFRDQLKETEEQLQEAEEALQALLLEQDDAPPDITYTRENNPHPESPVFTTLWDALVEQVAAVTRIGEEVDRIMRESLEDQIEVLRARRRELERIIPLSEEALTKASH